MEMEIQRIPLPPPGVERDSLIAERVLGWSLVPDDGRKNPPPPGTYQDVHGVYRDTTWSQGGEYSPAGALWLLAWWVNRTPAHRGAKIRYLPSQWMVEVEGGSWKGIFRHTSSSLSDAITAAILAASGVVG